MKINNGSITAIYIVLVMFLPNTMYILNQPGMPLISYRRCFIWAWIFFYVFLMMKKKTIRNQIFDLPYSRSVIIFSVILGLISACTFINNSQSISYYISIIIESIFPVVIIWSAFKEKEILLNVIRKMVYTYTLMALYGILSYIFDYNPLLDLLSDENGESTRILMYTYGDSERAGIRGRAQSFFAHAIQFGYLSSAILVFMFGVQKGVKLFSAMEFLLICIILISAALSAASRSPILFLMTAAFVYLAHLNIINLFRVIILSIISLSFLVYSDLLNVIFGNHLQFITSTFEDISTGNSTLGGSNLDMRLTQLAAAMDFFWESPIYGHGFAYIRTLLENKSTGDLLGGESFAFSLLVETGVLGIIGYFVLYIGIYSSFKKYLKYSNLKVIKNLAIAGIALLSGHIAFIFSTGELGMTYIYLILATLLLRLLYFLYDKRNQLTTNHHNFVGQAKII